MIDGLEGSTRVCAYDRASLGRSDPVPGPRTFHEMTRDLQVLLEKAHIGSPYILVGWSMGGLLVRIFADQHPGEVTGIVLLDSAHPDMGLRLLACLPPDLATEPENIQYLRQYFIWMSDAKMLPSFIIDKNVDIRSGMQQARAASTLGDLPLVVISQGLNVPGLGLDWGPLPRETEACLQQTWQDMQGELLRAAAVYERAAGERVGDVDSLRRVAPRAELVPSAAGQRAPGFDRGDGVHGRGGLSGLSGCPGRVRLYSGQNRGFATKFRGIGRGPIPAQRVAMTIARGWIAVETAP